MGLANPDSQEGNMPGDHAEERPWKEYGRRFVDGVVNVNDYVNKSTFGRVFQLKDSGHVSQGP